MATTLTTAPIANHLTFGETPRYKAKVSWWGQSGLLLLAGLLTLTAYGIPVSLLLILIAYFRRKSAILLITDKRIVCQRGLVRKVSCDVPLRRIESIDVIRDLNGRIGGYGTVVICGIGGTRVLFPFMKNPAEARRIATSLLLETPSVA
jgi:uncharacterized membrane protein YdbT with pleckstrin-like domain